jgi:hypothetical protein
MAMARVVSSSHTFAQSEQPMHSASRIETGAAGAKSDGRVGSMQSTRQ